MNRFDYSRIEHLMPTLELYIDHHIPTGGILEAVLSNDLSTLPALQTVQGTFGSCLSLEHGCTYEAPGICSGSRERRRQLAFEDAR